MDFLFKNRNNGVYMATLVVPGEPDLELDEITYANIASIEIFDNKTYVEVHLAWITIYPDDDPDEVEKAKQLILHYRSGKTIKLSHLVCVKVKTGIDKNAEPRNIGVFSTRKVMPYRIGVILKGKMK
jgi:hypothetical protein